jgi:hypothetical protein
MRASWLSMISVCCGVACSSSAALPPANDAGAGDESRHPGPRVPLSGDGAPQIAFVGQPCMNDLDCFGNGCSVAVDGFPGGYCLADCRMTGHICPMEASCVALNADTPACYRSCVLDSDCRMSEGYRCLDVGTAILMTGAPKICYPSTVHLACNFNTDCPPSVPHCAGGWMSIYGDASVNDSGASPPMPGGGTCAP